MAKVVCPEWRVGVGEIHLFLSGYPPLDLDLELVLCVHVERGHFLLDSALQVLVIEKGQIKINCTVSKITLFSAISLKFFRAKE
jgi:hypothetical protein